MVEAYHVQTSGNANDYGIIATSLNGTSGRLISQFNNESAQSITSIGWSAVDFNDEVFTIGASASNGFADANIEEIIIYNRELTEAEKLDVRNYLNTKYKIY